jgi:hypothetical protein
MSMLALCPTQPLINEYWRLFPQEQGSRSVKLITYPHPVRRTMMSGTLLLHSACDFIMWFLGTETPVEHLAVSTRRIPKLKFSLLKIPITCNPRSLSSHFPSLYIHICHLGVQIWIHFGNPSFSSMFSALLNLCRLLFNIVSLKGMFYFWEQPEIRVQVREVG